MNEEARTNTTLSTAQYRALELCVEGLMPMMATLQRLRTDVLRRPATGKSDSISCLRKGAALVRNPIGRPALRRQSSHALPRLP
jgi:hypothetical protein